jgi:hypothetical protein
MPDIESLHREYELRRKRSRMAFGATFAFALIVVAGIWRDGEMAGQTDGARVPPDRLVRRTFLSSLEFMRDTVYTTMPGYIEVLLDSQILIYHKRDGLSETHGISSGNLVLNKGIETRTGIFVVQAKTPVQISKQFDDAKMLNWIQFNSNIGFHSLEGRRYYWNLGKRPSSHGCVRLSQESAKQLYKEVAIGTPVIVHKNTHARVVAFLPDGMIPDTTQRPAEEIKAIYERRLRDLYRGDRLYTVSPVIPLSRKNIAHAGIPVGDDARIPRRQRMRPASWDFQTAVRIVSGGI